MRLHISLFYCKLYASSVVIHAFSTWCCTVNYTLALFTPLRLYTSTPLHLYAFTPLHLYASTPVRLYTSTPLRLSTPLRF